jgi:hypothetical protein
MTLRLSGLGFEKHFKRDVLFTVAAQRAGIKSLNKVEEAEEQKKQK